MKRSLHQSTHLSTSNDSSVIAAECARRLVELRAYTGETQKQLALRLVSTPERMPE